MTNNKLLFHKNTIARNLKNITITLIQQVNYLNNRI